MSTHRLEKPNVAETSLVNRGAQKQRFLLRKGQEEPMNLEAIMKTVLEGEVDGEEALDALLAKAALSEEETTRVKAAVRLLDSVRDKLSDEVMESLGKVSGMKKADTPPKPGDEPETEEEKAKRLAKENPVPKTPAVAKAGDILKDDGSINLEAVPEGMRPVVAALSKGLVAKDAIISAQADQLTKLADRTEALISEQRMDKLTKEADKTLRHLPGTSLEKAEVLKGLEALDPALQKRVGNLLKQADSAFQRNSMFDEVGTGGTGSGAGSAFQALKSAAEVINKAEPALTGAAAFDRAVEQNPALYNQYTQERKGH